MRPATETERTDEITRLAVLRKAPPDISDYVSLIEGITLDHLRFVVRYLLTTEDFFPTPRQLVDTATRLMPKPAPAPKRLEPSTEARTVKIPNPFGGAPLTVTITKDWYHDCTGCEDTGWRQLWCGDRPSPHYPWLPVQRCGCDGERPHDYAVRCTCLTTNPTILRRQARHVASDAAAHSHRRTA